MKEEANKEAMEIIEEYLNNPLIFIRDMFWLTPQTVLPEYEKLLEDCRKPEIIEEWKTLCSQSSLNIKIWLGNR